MVHVDPLVQVIAPPDRPDLKEAAPHETFVDTFVAWDILFGKLYPELGGSPEILDIVGVNNYSFGQMEYREQGPHQALDPGHPGIEPLCTLMGRVWDRYRRPIAYVDELRRWQKELNRVTAVDEDPYSDPVELQDVVDAAKRLRPAPDADWH
jgi:hypothetical protein